MGMNSLLGVGQGSANETFLVTLQWNGKKEKGNLYVLLAKVFVLIQEEFL